MLVRYAKCSYLQTRTRARASKYVLNLSNFYKSLDTHIHSSDPGISLAHSHPCVCVLVSTTHTHTRTHTDTHTDKIVINCVSSNKSNQPHVCRASDNANICTAIGGTQSYTLDGRASVQPLPTSSIPFPSDRPDVWQGGRACGCDTQRSLLPGRRRRGIQ